MEYLIFLIILIVVFLTTKYYYTNVGYKLGAEEKTKHIGNSLIYFATWFNKLHHPPMVGNTLYEIGVQLITYGDIYRNAIRDLVESEGMKRYHNNLDKYTSNIYKN